MKTDDAVQALEMSQTIRDTIVAALLTYSLDKIRDATPTNLARSERALDFVKQLQGLERGDYVLQRVMN